MKIKRTCFTFLIAASSTLVHAQFTNKGAAIYSKGDVVISSSMDIQNKGEINLQGTLDLKGKRKIASETKIVAGQINLSEATDLHGNLEVNKHLDFGQGGLLKVQKGHAVTFGPAATYANYTHGKGIKGAAQKIDAQDFVFPLGTETEAFPMLVKEKQALVEAGIEPQFSTELGDFNERGLEMPNKVAIRVNASSEMQASKLNLAFDEQKEEVVLDKGLWVEANKAKPSTQFLATKAMAYNRATALESSENRWVQVYPNPSASEINISMSEKDALGGEVKFRIVDIKGAVINQEKKAGKDLIGTYKLPDGLINGTYLLEFEHDNGKRSVVKQVVNR